MSSGCQYEIDMVFQMRLIKSSISFAHIQNVSRNFWTSHSNSELAIIYEVSFVKIWEKIGYNGTLL